MTKKILIVFYSSYGHIHKLATEIKKGIEKVPGVEVKIFKVKETLPEEATKKLGFIDIDVPVLEPHSEEVAQADGILFGIPSRFGSAPAQIKTFIDGLGSHWRNGALIGKPAGVFFSTGQQHGGLESIAISTVINFTHLGLVYVPLGYSTPLLFDGSEIIGGSQYGAGTIAGGQGTRQPSEKELAIAQHHGEHFAKFVNRLQ